MFLFRNCSEVLRDVALRGAGLLDDLTNRQFAVSQGAENLPTQRMRHCLSAFCGHRRIFVIRCLRVPWALSSFAPTDSASRTRSIRLRSHLAVTRMFFAIQMISLIAPSAFTTAVRENSIGIRLPVLEMKAASICATHRCESALPARSP